MPVTFFCEDCLAEFLCPVYINREVFECPDCGSTHINILQNDESA